MAGEDGGRGKEENDGLMCLVQDEKRAPRTAISSTNKMPSSTFFSVRSISSSSRRDVMETHTMAGRRGKIVI